MSCVWQPMSAESAALKVGSLEPLMDLRRLHVSCKDVPILVFCRYADTPILIIADMPIRRYFQLQKDHCNIDNIGMEIACR